MLLCRLRLAVSLVRLLEQVQHSALQACAWDRHPFSRSIFYFARTSLGFFYALGYDPGLSRLDRLLG
jgi:hypothetical protein